MTYDRLTKLALHHQYGSKDPCIMIPLHFSAVARNPLPGIHLGRCLTSARRAVQRKLSLTPRILIGHLRWGMKSTIQTPGALALLRLSMPSKAVVRNLSSSDWMLYPYVTRKMILEILLLIKEALAFAVKIIELRALLEDVVPFDLSF